MEADLSDEELFLASDAFARTDRPARRGWDDDIEDPEASTYVAAEHGPSPVPEWVITSDEARQFERGIVKSGKEAEVFLVGRRLGDEVNLLAAKRYREFEDRMFRNDARYRQGRRTGNSRADRAMSQGSRAGMAFRARQWVETEFETLGRLWSAGVSVPYPVQRIGREIMIEFLGDEHSTAPRLVHFRGTPDEFRDLFDQLVVNLTRMVESGVVHGDLSPYNVLVWDGRIYLIDFPQAVDPILNPDGLALLERGALHTCSFFDKHGVKTDPSALIGELVGAIFP